MREILFKAKRIDNGEWVEGYYFKAIRHWHKYGIHEDWIVVNAIQNGGYCNVCGKCAIDVSTLCQYTGLTDKNGNKIWENDIVSFLDFYCTDNGYAESWCIGKVLWDEETVSFQVTERLSAESYEVLGDCKVIGNIFDNPELQE